MLVAAIDAVLKFAWIVTVGVVDTNFGPGRQEIINRQRQIKTNTPEIIAIIALLDQ
jgi:hypothetical protein